MGRPMKNRSFSSKDDVAVGYEISGTSRVDSGRTLCVAMTWTSQLQASPEARYAAVDEQRAIKARMEALHP